MSSKPASKISKHSAQGHKHDKKGETPELHGSRDDGSPTGSLIGEGGVGNEGGTAVHPLDEVLTGDEIQALRITEEKLRKVHPPSSPISYPHKPSKRVMVRRMRAPEDTHSRNKRVAVLRPLPTDVRVGATRTLELGRQGRKVGGGRVPVLGSVEDFTTAESEGISPAVHTSPISQPPHITSHTSPHTFSYRDTVLPRQTHALQYWNEAMENRKHQQDYLAKKLHKSPERLAMNQGDGYRQVQEERMKIDRAIPPLDYGKGYRVGSEFWSQTVPIGDTETGINITLSRSEKGQPLPLELVGIPSTIRREKGMPSAERNAPVHYTWHTAPYLMSRTQQLQSTVADTLDVKPEMDELQVIGRGPHCLPEGPHDRSPDPLDSLGEEESYSEDSLSSNEETPPEKVTSLDMLPDTFFHPIVGPALTIRGHLLKWEGAPAPDLENKLEPVDLRVTFESGVDEEITSHLAMENSGTTAIYFSWEHLAQPNPLQTVQVGDTQRFYFDTRGGVLLPGQELSFPFVFKSPNAGIFTETWALQTGPVLASGKGIRVTLRGVAFQEDTNAYKRDELERKLKHRVAVVAAERLINQIVNSISTPPNSAPPMLTTPTEEDIFRTKNSHLFYHYNTVRQLKALYDEILRPELQEDHPPPSATAGDSGHSSTPVRREKGKPAHGAVDGGKKDKDKAVGGGKEKVAKESATEATVEPSSSVPDWDLSTDSLLQVVLDIEEDEVREEKLKSLNGLLGELSFPPPTLPSISAYSLVYQLVSEAMEQVSASSQRLCKVMGLPQRECGPVKTTSTEEDQLSSTASSSAVSSKKEKDKKGKKHDTKKGVAGKEKERAPSRAKGITGRKSKTSVISKDADSTETPAEQQSTPQPMQVDPVLEKNYKNNFRALVYGILSDTIDNMVLMLAQQT